MSVSRRDLFKLAGVGALVSALSSKPSFAAAERVGKMGAMLPPPKETGWWCVVEDGQV
jgi:hypothetical protein